MPSLLRHRDSILCLHHTYQMRKRLERAYHRKNCGSTIDGLLWHQQPTGCVHSLMFRWLFFFQSCSGCVIIKVKLPLFHVSITCRRSIEPDAPVATAAHAKATGRVGVSTRPDPEKTGVVEIATRRCPHLRVVWNLRELTHEQRPRLWSLPAGLGPVTVHPTRWGVGPRWLTPTTSPIDDTIVTHWLTSASGIHCLILVSITHWLTPDNTTYWLTPTSLTHWLTPASSIHWPIPASSTHWLTPVSTIH